MVMTPVELAADCTPANTSFPFVNASVGFTDPAPPVPKLKLKYRSTVGSHFNESTCQDCSASATGVCGMSVERSSVMVSDTRLSAPIAPKSLRQVNGCALAAVIVAEVFAVPV